MENFTHFDQDGNARMVDITEKEDTRRIAVAQGSIVVSELCYRHIMDKTVEKGDVLATARIAGIMGAKRTAELIPLCHIISLTGVTLDFTTEESIHKITAICTARTRGRTGVEMEALTGVSTALLTIYDMCKAIDKEMEIGQIHLISKSGGKSGEFFNSKHV